MSVTSTLYPECARTPHIIYTMAMPSTDCFFNVLCSIENQRSRLALARGRRSATEPPQDAYVVNYSMGGKERMIRLNFNASGLKWEAQTTRDSQQLRGMEVVAFMMEVVKTSPALQPLHLGVSLTTGRGRKRKPTNHTTWLRRCCKTRSVLTWILQPLLSFPEGMAVWHNK